MLARTTPLDPATAALGMIAGGASGIVGMSGELGADDRLVAFMQYLRVLVVVVLTPVGIAIFFGGEHGDAAAAVPGVGTFGEPWQWLLTAALARSARPRRTGCGSRRACCSARWCVTAAAVLSGLGGDFAVPRCSGRRRSR